MRKLDKLMVLLTFILSLICFLIANRSFHLYTIGDGNFFDKFTFAYSSLLDSLKNDPFFIDTSKIAVVFGLILALLPFMFTVYQTTGRTNFMPGIENIRERKLGHLGTLPVLVSTLEKT